MTNRMERKDQHRKRKQITKIILLILITFIIFGLIYKVGQNLLTLYNRNQRETMIPKYGCLEDKYQGQGIILRSEKPIPAPANGFFENTAAEEERVRRQDLLGYYQAAGKKSAVYAPVAGIFTRQVDGLEKALQEIKLPTVSAEIFAYKVQSTATGTEIKKGQDFCKIVNNLIPSQLLLRFPLEKRKMQVSKDQEVLLYDDDKALGSFNVVAYKKDANAVIMLVETAEFREDLLNQRFIKVKMAIKSPNGYLVPQKSLLNRGQEKGIYCTKSEEIVYKPVKVLTVKDDIAVVEGLKPTDIIIVNPRVVKDAP